MVATAAPTQTLTFTRTINAPIEQVYQSFVNRDDLCDWLCYDALINAADDGYIFVTWYDGQIEGQTHAYGKINALEENKHVAFTWEDNNSSTSTHVDFKLQQAGDAVELTLTHTGFADDVTIETIQHYQQMWDARLDELKSILETGARKSTLDRVIIGIFPDAFNESVAAELGVPVTEGARIGNLVPDYSAANAGLQVNDVIVSVNGQDVSSGTGINQNVAGKVPGDVVDVTYYRGAEKRETSLKLMGYPIPPIPEDFEEMAQQQEQRYADLEDLLDDALADYSPAVDDFRLEDDAYTVKETLAHLILLQRHNLLYFATYAEGPRKITPFMRNRSWINALVNTYDTVEGLREEIRRTAAEIVALCRTMPSALLERKNYIWWMNFEVHSLPILYTRFADRIKRTIATAA